MATRFRALIAAGTIYVALVAILSTIGTAAYVFPHTDRPAKTDVVFVIGPPTTSRLALAEKMVKKGLSTNVMISVSPDGRYNSAKNISLCEDESSRYRVYCGVPDPFTTQGEARWLKAMAAEHGWTSATVITFTPHITRARVLMDRCFTGDLRMVADRRPLSLDTWVYQYLYQTGAFLRVAIDQDC